ncbi:MAG: MFS transporter, partial [Bacteroidales bacterium]|nr:MFS transporter [Bacteroidales bacterium]
GVNNSGLFFIILSIGIGLSRVFSGKVIDAGGPKQILIIGMLLLLIGFPILGLMNNPVGYHIAAAVLGLGFGVIMPTFQTMVNNMVDGTRRGAANSTFFTAFDLGIGFGMMGTGALSQVLGFNKTFSLFALVILVSLVLFLASTSKHYSKAVLGK